MLRVICLFSLLALLGCGAGSISDTDGTDTSTSSDTGTSSTDSSGDGDGDGDGDGEPGDGDGDGDGDEPPLVCPPPQPVTASFTVSPATPLTATCVVIEEIYDNDLYHLELDCDGAPVVIDVESTIIVQPYIYPMTMVELDYRIDPDAPNDRWLAVHPATSDLLVLGGVSASHLDPPGTTLAEFFRNPDLRVSIDQPCEGVPDSCGDAQRLALDVTIDRFGVTGDPVFDHGSWFADFLAFGFAIEVETATRRVPPNECDDAPDEWFALVAVGFPSD